MHDMHDGYTPPPPLPLSCMPLPQTGASGPRQASPRNGVGGGAALGPTPGSRVQVLPVRHAFEWQMLLTGTFVAFFLDSGSEFEYQNLELELNGAMTSPT
uniref:Uncharacterized protein n=1 Tax=Eutreptiella gymnastica TaxID=73025 RepID=A0A7S1J4T4_9EUGL|mmetsp:Transcript_65925/g.117236  ORF Transcript_65925/g.117236 Transcript_65925/m.117236 type:complete len:100 (+) Transcript_65925:55-354(+)